MSEMGQQRFIPFGHSAFLDSWSCLTLTSAYIITPPPLTQTLVPLSHKDPFFFFMLGSLG